jgi:hypothetical protein
VLGNNRFQRLAKCLKGFTGVSGALVKLYFYMA